MHIRAWRLWYVQFFNAINYFNSILYWRWNINSGSCTHDRSVAMRNLLALLAGGTFGIGLLISGMTDTKKVQGLS